ncbi:hypothetical protein MMC28_005897 [Mycoblastus sanguinarius]|nr:hypothetical protein [Mycoblastus sanguinarius]
MLEYNSIYQVLICPLHKYAVPDPEGHLRMCHGITGSEKDLLLRQWKKLTLIRPEKFVSPPAGRPPKAFLASPSAGFRCLACGFLTSKWREMRSHQINFHCQYLKESEAVVTESPNVRLVRIQTFFSFPHIRWFVVENPPTDPSTIAGFIPDDDDDDLSTAIFSEYTEDDGALREESWFDYYQYLMDSEHLYNRMDCHYYADYMEQRRHGPREWRRSWVQYMRTQNFRFSLLHRLPYEIRLKVYNMVLPAGNTYHIIDERAPAKPDLSRNLSLHRYWDEFNEISSFFDLQEVYENALEKAANGRFVADRTTKFRVISLPRSAINIIAILMVSSDINVEACPIFYSQNQFRIHSGTADFSTTLQFLSLLSPRARKSITSFGLVGLQPCQKLGLGRYGVKGRDANFNCKCDLYYRSEEAFYTQALPEMPLKELSLGFDLNHLENDVNGDVFNEYSPQTLWLNKFLRLPIKRINLEFGTAVWKNKSYLLFPIEDVIEERTSESYLLYPIEDVIEELIGAFNKVDLQARIRAKRSWEDEFGQTLWISGVRRPRIYIDNWR